MTKDKELRIINSDSLSKIDITEYENILKKKDKEMWGKGGIMNHRERGNDLRRGIKD